MKFFEVVKEGLKQPVIQISLVAVLTSGYQAMTNGWGIGQSNGMTWVDSAQVASKWSVDQRIKYSDTASLFGGFARSNISLRYSDTAAMLSPYLRSVLGVKYTDTAAMLAGYYRRSEFKKDTVYKGTTDASGNITFTYPVAYVDTPTVIPTIQNQSDKAENAIITATSKTGFTCNVYTRAGVTTLPIVGALGTTILSGLTTNVAGRRVNVLIKPQ